MPLLNHGSIHSSQRRRGLWHKIPVPRLFLHTGLRMRLQLWFLILLLLPIILMLLFILLAPYHTLREDVWILRVCSSSCKRNAIHIGVLSACSKINGGRTNCVGGFPTNYWTEAIRLIVPPILRNSLPERDSYEGSFLIVTFVLFCPALVFLAAALHRMKKFRSQFKEEEDYAELMKFENSSKKFAT